jgi:D-alanyl-lipoteichoic acid acyltransferase DltB (MBOAT superfamily)
VGKSGSAGGIDAVEDRSARISTSVRTRALFLSWAIMGFWHGANWTFLMWGLWHATVVWLYRQYLRLVPDKRRVPGGLSRYISIIPTMLFIMPGWIFFRADTLGQAFSMLKGLVNFSSLPHLGYLENYYLATMLMTTGFFAVFFIKELKLRIPRFQWLFNAILYAVMAISIVACFENEQQFIYFQF